MEDPKGVKFVEVIFRGEQRPNVGFKEDIGKYSVSAVCQQIFNKYVFDKSRDLNDWEVMVNGVIMNTLEQSKKTLLKNVQGRPIQISLRFKLESTTPPPPPPQKQEGTPYNLKKKILKLTRTNMKLFKTDMETNGMMDQEIRFAFGHFYSKLPSMQLPLNMNDDVYINLDFNSKGSSLWVLDNIKNIGKRLIVSPHSTWRHAALICVFNQQRVIHIDASSSVSVNNGLLMQKHLTNISYTYLNYQSFDETNIDEQYAGGNCAVFTCLNGLRMIFHYDEYNDKKYNIDDFWQRFIQVASVSTKRTVLLMLNEMYYKLFYMNLTENGKKREDYGKGVKSVFEANMLPDFISESIVTLRAAIQSLSANIDFSADCIMLDLFIQSKMSFENISALGNMLRSLLTEITTHGFVEAYCKFIGTNYKAVY
jgi:hypothetical protein